MEELPQYTYRVRDYERLNLFLRQNHWPQNLINTFVSNINSTSKIYFIYDDSGSMSGSDGKIFKDEREVNCSRWEELLQAFNFNSMISILGSIETNVKFLNAGSYQFGNSYVTETDSFLRKFQEMNGGYTPLAKTLREIINDLKDYRTYSLNTEKAQVTIYTDGEPSDCNNEEFKALLKDLIINQNANVTIRLLTDEENVLNYWNSIESDVELNLDIIDNFLSECKEVENINPKICYPYQIHQLREFGIALSLFDHLDERILNNSQLKQYISLFIDQDISGLDLTKYQDQVVLESYMRQIEPLKCFIHNNSRLPVNFFQEKCKTKKNSRCIVM